MIIPYYKAQAPSEYSTCLEGLFYSIFVYAFGMYSLPYFCFFVSAFTDGYHDVTLNGSLSEIAGGVYVGWLVELGFVSMVIESQSPFLESSLGVLLGRLVCRYVFEWQRDEDWAIPAFLERYGIFVILAVAPSLTSPRYIYRETPQEKYSEYVHQAYLFASLAKSVVMPLMKRVAFGWICFLVNSTVYLISGVTPFLVIRETVCFQWECHPYSRAKRWEHRMNKVIVILTLCFFVGFYAVSALSQVIAQWHWNHTGHYYVFIDIWIVRFMSYVFPSTVPAQEPLEDMEISFALLILKHLPVYAPQATTIFFRFGWGIVFGEWFGHKEKSSKMKVRESIIRVKKERIKVKKEKEKQKEKKAAKRVKRVKNEPVPGQRILRSSSLWD